MSYTDYIHFVSEVIAMKLLIALFSTFILLNSCAPQQKQEAVSEKSNQVTQQSLQKKTLVTIPVTEALDILKTPDLVILDVRTPAEFQEGHLKNAQSLDFYASDFQSRLLTLDKKKPYLLYCHSGTRSGKTLKMLQEAGFEKVYDLAGGYQSWKAAGQPVQQ
jgi:phage shock protein E